jgi:hypothetical protein
MGARRALSRSAEGQETYADEERVLADALHWLDQKAAQVQCAALWSHAHLLARANRRHGPPAREHIAVWCVRRQQLPPTLAYSHSCEVFMCIYVYVRGEGGGEVRL